MEGAQTVQTVGAVVIVALAVMPGALYAWSFERMAGRWGIGLTDRLLRFVVGSLAFHALAAPLTYAVYARLISTGRVARGEPMSLWLWPLVLAYVAAPVVAGTAVGLGTIQGSGWARFVSGPHPVPRAFDHLFALNPSGWVRVRLHTGIWVGGAYARHPNGRSSYAGLYPEAGDIYLVSAAEVDTESGEFLLDGSGRPLMREDRGVLLKWSDIDYLEFIHA